MRGPIIRRSVGLLLAAAALTAAPAATGSTGAGEQARVDAQIERYKKETWKWQRMMQKPLTKLRNLANAPAPQFRMTPLNWWRKQAYKARTRAQNPPHKRGWLCIHRHERHARQGWRTNTGNGFYGGLQMNMQFMRAHGARLLRAKGTANRWTPLEQIWVAVRAHRSGRGFRPWPNTGRACGLI